MNQPKPAEQRIIEAVKALRDGELRDSEQRRESRFHEAVFDMMEECSNRANIIAVALDLLGVPAENSAHFDAQDDNAVPPDDYMCRDYLYSCFMDEKMPFGDFLVEVEIYGRAHGDLEPPPVCNECQERHQPYYDCPTGGKA